MKLLIMGNNGHLGGLSVHYTTLLHYLEKEDIQLFCININDKNERIFNDGRVTEVVIPFQPSSVIDKIKKYFALYRVAAKAKKFMPDVFVAAGLGYGYAMIASKLPATVFKVFEEVHFEATADKLRLKMIKCFDAVATQTKGMVQPFKLNVSADKPVNFLPCFSKEYTLNSYFDIPGVDKGVKVAYFGRLAWNKGLREFINSASSVFHINSDLTLDIYGGGSEKELIQKEINVQGLGKQILLKGHYGDEDFASLISSYHGIVLPSISTEGLPLILIEAMSFGRPVFTTTTGAMPEVGEINKEGMLVSEKDKPAMEANFKLFLQNIKAGKYKADYIHNIYKENFSNEAFKQIWLNMLQDPAAYFLSNQQ